MAISTSTNYHSNSIVGQPMAGADINIYDLHSTPHYAVGFGFERSDGNKYRYAQFGAAVSASRLVASKVSNNILTAVATNTALASNTTTAVAGDPIKPGDKGSHYMEIYVNTTTPTNAQILAGGYVAIVGGTGQGYMHRIKSQTAVGTPSTNRARLELWEPLAVTVDTTTDLSIMTSPYADLTSDTSGVNLAVVGVSVSAPSSTQYAWIQTKGIALVLQDADTATIGLPIAASTTTAGAIAQYRTSTVTSTGLGSVKGAQLGYLIDNGTSAGSSLVYLQIE